MPRDVKISVVTPTIRIDGLKPVAESLKEQTFQEFEWLPRLSIPRGKPDLCYQMNKAIQEAQGKLVVFVQDWIKLPPNALERAWEMHKLMPTVCWTMPVSKVDTFDNPPEIRHDWRKSHLERNPDGSRDIRFHEWEIDFGSAPRYKILEAGGFYEEYDNHGIGHENVDLAYRLQYLGCTFKCDSENGAIVYDHDKFTEHPWKPTSTNAQLWNERRFEIDKASWS